MTRDEETLLKLLMSLVERRDQHRGFADSLEEPRRSYEKHLADETIRLKFEEIITTVMPTVRHGTEEGT